MKAVQIVCEWRSRSLIWGVLVLEREFAIKGKLAKFKVFGDMLDFKFS